MAETPVIWKDITQVNTTDAAATGGTNLQYNPQIAPLENGGYVVVWTDESRTHNPSGTAILGQRYDALGQKVGGEVELSRPQAGSFGQPAVTTLSNGNIAVAFDDQLFATDKVYVRVFDASLKFLREDPIDSGGNPATTASITALAGGGYALSSTVAFLGDTDVVGFIRDASGTAVGSPFNWDDGASDFEGLDDQHQSELATLSNGNVVAVWQDEFSHNPAVFDIRFAIRSPAGTLVNASGFIGVVGEAKPDVAALKGGGFVVAWTSGTDVVAHLLDNAGNRFGSLIKTASTAGNQHAPSVTELADGGFLLTWNDDAVFPGAIRGQRFTGLGVEVGQEFTLNNFATVRSQLNNEESAVALLSDGRVAFATNTVPSPGDYDVITSMWDPRTSVDGTAAGETLTSTPSGGTVNGGGGNDTLVGFGGPDTLDGGPGSDLMQGGSGDDTYIVDDAGDQVVENYEQGVDAVLAAISHALAANIEKLALIGIGAINGTGNELANVITGNDVANLLAGALGMDTLTGGGGADSFVFNTALDAAANLDTITDFSHDDDMILLDNAILAKLRKDGELKKKYFEIGKKADDKDDFILYNKKTGLLSYDADGLKKKFDAIAFAQLEDHLKLKADDFLVI